jgi:hypothetical protein
MIYLRFPEKNKQIESWRERLDSFLIDYKFEETPSLDRPVILEGKQEYAGKKAIEQFLKELEDEINDWRTPRCGV